MSAEPEPSPSDPVSRSASPPWSVITKAIVAVVAIVLVGIIIWRFQSFITPIVIAAIVAYLFNPLIRLVESHGRMGRGRAVAVVYVVLLLLLAVGGLVVGIVTVDQAAQLYANLPSLLDRALGAAQAWADRLSVSSIAIGPIGQAGPFVIYPAGLLDQVDGQELLQQAYGWIEPAFARGGSLAAQLAQATLSTIGTVLLVFTLSIYLAKDAPRFGQTISNLAHQPGYREDADRLMADFFRIWNAYLRGQVILALVIGGVVSLSLAALGVSNAFALGALSGVLEFLPIVGPIIGAAAAILVAVFQPDNYLGLSPLWYGLLVAGVMLVIQQVENSLLVPRIVGDALDLHPLVVMVSVLMGASLAGLLGAVLAAPVVASIKLGGTYAWRKMLDLPPFEDEDKPQPQMDTDELR